MNTQTLIDKLIDAGIEESEARREVSLLLEFFCNYTELDKLKGRKLNTEELRVLEEKVLLRVDKRLPVQYIIGESWFMGNFYKVTPDVLIPRDETELLVQRAIEIIKSNSFEDVLDIGTGSGCIACSIAKNTKATVLGVDISSDALRIALDNVTNLGINNKAIFRKSNLFEKIREGEIFDVIISNPPYIPYQTCLSPEVKHEPELALFADENGLSFYRKIIEKAPQFLNEDGYLMFELGIGHSLDVKRMMGKSFKNIIIEKDFAGIDRIIYGQKN